MKTITRVIEGEEVTITTSWNGWEYQAITSNYDGPEDKINIAGSSISEDDAANQLIEQIEESILSKQK